MSSGAKFPAIAWVSIAAALAGCSDVKKLGFQGGAAADVGAFAGVAAIQLDPDGSYDLLWNAATGETGSTQYQVFMQDIGAGATMPSAGVPLQLAASSRTAKLASQGDTSADPRDKGTKLTTIVDDKHSYTITSALDPTHTYAFMVMAADASGNLDGNTAVLLLSADLSVTYAGCKDATNITATGARIEIIVPDNASQVFVFRDGAQVFTTNSSSSTVDLETNLTPGQTYTYTCTAKVGTELWQGLNQLKVTTLDPLKDFTGCTSATVQGSTSVNVTFPFPDGADEMQVIRDGTSIFTSTSNANTTFLDTGLSPGTTYEYTCRLNVGTTTQLGTNKIDVRIPSPLDALTPFAGCVSGKAQSISSILLTFQNAAGVDFISVFRDGVLVDTTSSSSTTTFLDTNLNEGQTYTYTCEASALGNTVKGTNAVTVTTLAPDPPSFAGIKTATATGPNTVQVTWGSSTGVAVANFNVYASLGSTVDFTQPPLLMVPAGNLTATITGLGDELPYAFAVVACSTFDKCGPATQTPALVTTPDGGPPTTAGVTAAKLSNAAITLTVPWTPANGAVAQRLIYRCTGASDAACGGTLANYGTPYQVQTVADVTSPPTSIVINNLTAQTTYYFIVRDQDPSGNVNQNRNFVSVYVDKLTPPIFSGISALDYGTGSMQETSLNVSFNAIKSETADPVGGASTYIISYVALGATPPGAAVPANCAGGTATAPLQASLYTNGQTYTIPLTGLSPRTKYAVCVDAADHVPNTTSTTPKALWTKDTTAPAFAGIQSVSFNGATSSLHVTWNPSASADLEGYKLSLWSVDADGTVHTTYTTPVLAATASPSSYDVAQSEYAIEGPTTVYAMVNACDNAETIPGSTQNCNVCGSDTCTVTAPVAKTISMPDITPPSNFPGISQARLPSTVAEGEMVVSWAAPSPALSPQWKNYAGFFVYYVDPVTTNLAGSTNCPCLGADCASTPLTSCTVNDPGALAAYKYYDFYVRAYNTAGILTPLPDSTTWKPARTADTQPPTMQGAPSAAYANASVTLTWPAAIDNQYSGDGATISYKIYRLGGSNFNAADWTAPTPPVNWSASTFGSEAGVTPLTSTTNAYVDSSVTTGTYYYVICAQDASTNESCYSQSLPMVVPKTSIPTISATVAPKTQDGKLWQIDYTINDSGEGDHKVYIYYNTSASPLSTALTLADVPNLQVATDNVSDLASALYVSGGTNVTSSGMFPTPDPTACPATCGLIGPKGVRIYINYLLVVKDLVGNESAVAVSYLSDNTITVTGVNGGLSIPTGTGTLSTVTTGTTPNSVTTRNFGVIGGGNLVYIVGTGFAGSPTVTFGSIDGSGNVSGAPCTNPASVNGGKAMLVSPNEIFCVTSSHSAGTVDIIVANSDGSLAKLSQAYTYYDTVSAGANAYLCDLTANRGTDHSCSATGFAGGAGTVPLPYLVCSAVQLDNIRNCAGGYFQIADNIDLSSVASFTPLPTIANLTISGNGFIVANETYSGTNVDMGLISSASALSVSNLGLVNFNFTADGSCRIGALTGYVNGCTAITNVYSNGTITWSNTSSASVTPAAGGVIGLAEAGCPTSYLWSYVNVSIASNSDAISPGVGGVMGVIHGTYLTNGAGFGNITTAGSATAVCGGVVGDAPYGSTTIDHSSGAGNITCPVAGGIVGAGDSVSNSNATGAITGSVSAGGVIAQASGAITNSYATGNVTGLAAGGLVESVDGVANTISGSYATGNVTCTGGGGCGGLIGTLGKGNGGSITGSYATGQVTAAGHAGGLVGDFNTLSLNSSNDANLNFITRSYAAGRVSNSGAYSGGLIGFVNGGPIAVTIDSDFATGQTSGQGGPAGGLIGGVATAGSVTVSNTYALGSTTGFGSVGGLIGLMSANTGNSPASAVSDSFAANSLSGVVGGVTLGGLVGSLSNASSITSGCFWNNANGVAAGVGNVTDPATSEPTAQMQPLGGNGIYGTAGWDFSTPIWRWPASGAGYPLLGWQ